MEKIFISNKKSVFTTFLIGMCVLLSLFLLTKSPLTVAFAEDDPGTYWQGEGTVASPYLIEDKNDLTALGNFSGDNVSLAGKYFRIENNIDLEGDATNPWTPIELIGAKIDGNGKTISGLYITVPSELETIQVPIAEAVYDDWNGELQGYEQTFADAALGAGLFSAIADVTINNLTIDEPWIEFNPLAQGEYGVNISIGAIAGFVTASELRGNRVNEPHIEVVFQDDNINNSVSIGAMYGYIAYAELEPYSATFKGGIVHGAVVEGGTIEVTDSPYGISVNIGGVAGSMYKGVIYNAYTSCKIDYKGNSYMYYSGLACIGGIVGYNSSVSPTYGDNAVCVYNSYSSSEIIIDLFEIEDPEVLYYSGFWYSGFADDDIPSLFVGGIAGFLEKDHTVNTYFIGSITPGAYALGFDYVGEIFGYASDEDNGCFIEMNFYLEGTGRYDAVGVTNKTAWPEIDGTTAEQIASPIESAEDLLDLLIAGRIRSAHVSNEHGYVNFEESLNRMNSWKIEEGVNSGYPIFTLSPIIYTITLDENGGSYVEPYIEPTTYTYGEELTLPTFQNISKDGYIFVGWYDNSEFTGDPVMKISTTDSGDKNYYARWFDADTNILNAKFGQNQMFDLSYDNLNGLPFDSSWDENAYDADFHQFTTEVMDGRYLMFRFTGDSAFPWGLFLFNSDGTPVVAGATSNILDGSKIGLEENVCLTKLGKEFMMATMSSGFEGLIAQGKFSEYDDSSMLFVTQNGYTYYFTKLAFIGNESKPVSTNVVKNPTVVQILSITGYPTEILYYITYYKNTTDTVQNFPSTENKMYGTNVTLSSQVPTRTGYTFANWNTMENGTGTIYYTDSVYTENENLTLYAIWTINTYTVTFKNSDGTVISTESVNHGQGAQAPAQTPQKPQTNTTTYTFTGWDESFDEVTGDMIVTALFSESTRLYTVILKNEDGTIIETKQVEYDEIEEEETIIPEKPETDKFIYKFIGWQTTTDPETGNIIKIAMFEEISKTNLLYLWILLPILLLSIAGAAIWLFIFKKQTITFILNGKEVAKLKFKFNEKIILTEYLSGYKWFTDKKGTELFTQQKMKLKSITLYRISKTK